MSEKDGIWALEIQKVGHADQGVYECQTNTEVKTSVSIKLNVMGKSSNTKKLIASYTFILTKYVIGNCTTIFISFHYTHKL